MNKSCSEAPFLYIQTSRSSAGRTNGTEVCSYSCLWNTTRFLLRIIQLVNLKRMVNKSKFAITGKTNQKDVSYSVNYIYSIVNSSVWISNYIHVCTFRDDKTSMPTECLFKSGTKDTSAHECTAGCALWGFKHTWWSSMRALWSSRRQFMTLQGSEKTAKQANYRDLLLRKRHHRGLYWYTGHTPY